jgi:hypothetical protein
LPIEKTGRTHHLLKEKLVKEQKLGKKRKRNDIEINDRP